MVYLKSGRLLYWCYVGAFPVLLFLCWVGPCIRFLQQGVLCPVVLSHVVGSCCFTLMLICLFVPILCVCCVLLFWCGWFYRSVQCTFCRIHMWCHKPPVFLVARRPWRVAGSCEVSSVVGRCFLCHVWSAFCSVVHMLFLCTVGSQSRRVCH